LKALAWISRFTWELPQTLLGLIIFLLTKKASEKVHVDTFLTTTYGFGISLGAFIFAPDEVIYTTFRYQDPALEARRSILHEYGHSIQSKILGPLYLIIVGLPSLTMNLMSTYSLKYGSKKFYKNYYKRFPESWADSISKITR
jgi:hypothetical protein